MPTDGYERIAVDGGTVTFLRAGTGPELVVLLHGWPETAECWREVLPSLAERFTVVAPDLPGYGASTPSRHGGDKRAVAATLAAFVEELGFPRAFVAGHDRGARVAHRWAVDHPAQVACLAVLDVVPTSAMLKWMGPEAARRQWHWFFHASPAARRILDGRAREHILPFLESLLRSGTVPPDRVERYLDAYARPGGTEGFLADYRAALGSDLEAERADLDAQRRVSAPVLVLWGSTGPLADVDALDIWREYAPSVTGRALPCGHYLPEEQPAVVAAELLDFFGAESR